MDNRTDSWLQRTNLTVNYTWIGPWLGQIGFIIVLLFELLRVSQLSVISVLFVK